MAFLNVVQLGQPPISPSSGAQAAGLPYLVSEDVTLGVTAVQSSVFVAGTVLVRLCADADCRVAVGQNPTATATSPFFPANAPETFYVLAGHRLSAIAV